MELSNSEKIAFAMLQSQPEEIKKVAVGGNIQIKDLYTYFNHLLIQLELAQKKRDNEIVEVNSKRIENEKTSV